MRLTSLENILMQSMKMLPSDEKKYSIAEPLIRIEIDGVDMQDMFNFTRFEGK